MNVLNTPSRKTEEENIIKTITAGADVSLNGSLKDHRQAVESELNDLRSNRKKWQAAREAQDKAQKATQQKGRN